MSLILSRRSAIAGGLASAVALTLAACGSDSSSSSSAGSTASAAANATAVASQAPFYAAATAAPSGAVDVSGVATDGITVSGNTATISIGASPEPHVTILQWVQDNLTDGTGISLDIVSINDYQTPNSSMGDGSLAANFYQTPNFLQQQIQDKGYDFTGTAKVHIEPMGLYSDTVKSVDDIPDGGTIILNNDPANTARGYRLLETAGLITVDPTVELPTDVDVTENSKNLTFKTVDGAQVARSMADADAACINGNYALEAGLSPKDDSLVLEPGENSPYANELVVRTADRDNAALAKLAALLNSDELRTFITTNWTDESVIPAF